MIRTLLMRGLLHSDTLGSIRACRSPRLFAAYRVLLRLLMPRHPPCALISLNTFFAELCLVLKDFSQFRRSLKLYLPIFFEVLLHKKFGYLNFLFVVSLFNFQWTIRALKTFEVPRTYLVEIKRIELLTPCLQSRCSPSWAKPPFCDFKELKPLSF